MPVHFLGELVGRRFGRLVVIEMSHRHRKYIKYWRCLCDCGKEKITSQNSLIAAHVRSCGCLQQENRKTINRKHGMRQTRFYGIWKGINGRCHVPSNHAYSQYGAKGVTSEWKDSFIAFKRDMYQSYLKHVAKHGEKDTTIDRIDNSKGYSKANCRWATNREQSNNRSITVRAEIEGVTRTLVEWSEVSGIGLATIRTRYGRGLRGKALIASTLK